FLCRMILKVFAQVAVCPCLFDRFDRLFADNQFPVLDLLLNLLYIMLCQLFPHCLLRFLYPIFSAHSFSLNPGITKSSPTRSGRFTSIPSVARSSYCSSSLISFKRSFNSSSRYFMPL